MQGEACLALHNHQGMVIKVVAGEPLLRVSEVTKSFPGVQALKNVSMELRRGEIHAIIGENGAGKSTLAKILGGVERPDLGQLFLNGAMVNFHHVAEAIARGIGIIPQETNDFPNLTVADNLFVQNVAEHRFAFLKQRALFNETRSKLAGFGVELDPSRQVGSLSIGLRQILQILRTILLNSNLLILDEPTTSLDIDEAILLFKLLRELNAVGVTIVYVTHRLHELPGFADRVTVMRDGEVITTKRMEDVTEEILASLMVGRKIEYLYGVKKDSTAKGNPYFEVHNLTSRGLFRNVSFSLRHGEIIGFFGLIGAGRTELFKAILGLYPINNGEILLDGKPITLNGVKDAIRHSIAYLPEDRKQEGLFLKMMVDENLVAPQLAKFTGRLGLLSGSKIGKFAKGMVEDFNIVTPTLKQTVLHLSGGNQQKVLLAMWVGTAPQVLIVDEPTKGVDIGTRQMIYDKLRTLADQGLGITVISSDLPEILQLCDRIIVMHEGEITGELAGDEATEEEVMGYATKIKSAKGGQGRNHSDGE